MYSDRPTIMLYITDLPRSVAFYQDVLGFGFKGYWHDEENRVAMDWEDAGQPTYAEVDVAGGSVGLHVDDDFAMERPPVEMRIEVDDARSAYETFTENGADPSEPNEMPWGEVMFDLTDPDGHVWNFYERR